MLSKYLVVAVAALAGVASAQKCQAQNVLDRCLQDRRSVIGLCNERDEPAVYYHCLCNGYKGLQDCYINCPNDPTAGTVENEVSAWCISAGGEKDPNASTTTAGSPAQSGSSTPVPSGTTNDDEEGDETTGADESGASTTPSKVADGNNAAVAVGARVGAVLGAGVAVAAFVL